MMRKKYLILGATSGVGLGLVKKISKNNFVYCLGRNFKSLNEYAKKNNLKNKIKKIKIDLNTTKNFNFILKIKKIDYVICCLGLNEINLIKFYSDSTFNKILNINLIMPIKIISNLYKHSKINDNGSILFVSSILNNNEMAMHGTLAYNISKSGINGAIKTLALEFSEKNITVNAVAPGMTETPMIKKIKNQLSNRVIKIDRQKYLLGKKYLSISNVMDSVLFLISKKANKITGQVLKIDAGYTLKR